MSYSRQLSVRGLTRRLYTIFRPPWFDLRHIIKETQWYTLLPRHRLILSEEAVDPDGHVMRLCYIGGQSGLEHVARSRCPNLVPPKRSPKSFFSGHPLSHNWSRKLGVRWANTTATSSAGSGLPTREYLAYLKSIYPDYRAESGETVDAITRSAWYLIVAVAFGSSNRPEAVPKVFHFVHDELIAASATIEERRVVVRRLKEALFKSGLSCGYSRTINSLMALHYSLPDELRERELIRKIDHEQVSDIVSRGRDLFVAHYHEDADPVQSILDDIHPDLGWFSQNIGYGHVYGMVDVVSLLETSYMLITSLIAMDTPRQINWHMTNCQRIGASIDDVRAVRTIAMDVAAKCGMVWRNGVPEVNPVAQDHSNVNRTA